MHHASRLAPHASPGRGGEGRSSVLIVPYGTGVGDLALQRGLFRAVARRWPEARVSVYAPATARGLVPDEIAVVPRIAGIPAWQPVSGSRRAWRLLGPLEAPAIGALFRAVPLDALARLPQKALATRYDRVINFLGAFVGGVDFGRDWLPDQAGRATHIVDLLTHHLAKLGIDVPAGERTEPLPIAAADRAWADALIGRRAAARPVVLINPHAGSALKLPRRSFWRALVRHLAAAGLTPMLSSGGGVEEARLAASLAAAGGVRLPRTSLPRLVALAERASATVSPDTGLLHLVALNGARWVGLFGSTNPDLSGPYDRSRGRLIVARPARGRACGTCWQRFTVGSACCPVYAAGSCLTTLDPAVVAEAVLGLPR